MPNIKEGKVQTRIYLKCNLQLYFVCTLSSTTEDSPPGVLNSIDASFQMRLKELEEKQEVLNKYQKSNLVQIGHFRYIKI